MKLLQELWNSLVILGMCRVRAGWLAGGVDSARLACAALSGRGCARAAGLRITRVASAGVPPLCPALPLPCPHQVCALFLLPREIPRPALQQYCLLLLLLIIVLPFLVLPVNQAGYDPPRDSTLLLSLH